MARVDKLYDWLAEVDEPEVDRAFALALERAEPPYFERIVRFLMARDEPESWSAIASAFDRLNPEFQEELASDRERLRLAITGAARLPSPTARLQAMRLLRRYPFPQLAFVLSDALRDPHRPVSEMAAEQLLSVSKQFLKRFGADAAHDDEHDQTNVSFARRQLINALSDTLKSYPQHWRLEPVQAALWFVNDLGQDLWRPLNERRSRLREAVVEHLRRWDDPNLASFLLHGLKQPEWHGTVGPLLCGWSTRQHLEALLDHSDMLNDPIFRQRLAKLHDPNWFDHVDRYLNELSIEHRRNLPRWVFAVGLSVNERTSLLTRFLHRNCPVLRRACVYAMAALQISEVTRRIQQVGTSDAVMSAFARWWAAGRELQLDLEPQLRASSAGSMEKRAASRRRQTDQLTFDLVWDLCQRLPLRDAGQLLTLLRENMDIWGPIAVQKLRTESPRERILALHVFATEILARQYKQQLQRLLSDQIPAIRDLTRNLLQSVARLEAKGRQLVGNGHKLQIEELHLEPPNRSYEEIRADLLSYLNALQNEDPHVAVTPEGISALGAMLEDYRAARYFDEKNESATHEEPVT